MQVPWAQSQALSLGEFMLHGSQQLWLPSASQFFSVQLQRAGSTKSLFITNICYWVFCCCSCWRHSVNIFSTTVCQVACKRQCMMTWWHSGRKHTYTPCICLSVSTQTCAPMEWVGRWGQTLDTRYNIIFFNQYSALLKRELESLTITPLCLGSRCLWSVK